MHLYLRKKIAEKRKKIHIKKLSLINIFFLCVSMISVSKNPQLNVLFVVKSFPSTTQIFVLNQMTGLIDLGHKVTILSENPLRRNIRHHVVDSYKLMEKAYEKELPAGKKKFDVILCQFGSIGRRFVKNKNKHGISGKVITFFRGDDSRPRHFSNKNWYSELFQKGDFFLPVCKFFKHELIKAGCDASKISVLHSAIDLRLCLYKNRSLPRSGQPIRIIAVGRLVPKKGIKYLIYAIGELIKKNINVKLIIIGDGPSKEEISKLINELGLSHCVHLLGVKPHQEVMRLLNKTHIFVLPSVLAPDGDREGIPNVLKEAMAMGFPVVSTYHSGIPELIDEGISGFLVPQYDSKALAAKICFLIDRPEIWRRIGLAARRKIDSQFNMVKENKKLELICKKISSSICKNE